MVIRSSLLILILLQALAIRSAHAQPTIEARSKPVVILDGAAFRDLNDNGVVDPYEDWRLEAQQRIADLVSRMTLEEKAGMMLIDTLNSAAGGELPESASRLVNSEHMTRFIFRNPVVNEPDPTVPPGRAGAQITPKEAAEFTNRVQQLAEATRLGIPVLFKSNARNHRDEDARPGINVSASAFSEWPKEAGLAATRDMELIHQFGEIMAEEWSAIGLRGMYGYMADLATEPRWYRIHETFTEDADLAAAILRTLVESLQGDDLEPPSVSLTIKHFPGGGPQRGGGDPHYWFGREQAYPAGMFDYHVRPFEAAIDAGVSAIMAYYGIPVGQKYMPNDVGMAFSSGILTELLREELAFQGYINSDTGIIANRAWGLGDLSIDERIAVAIEAGTDVLSGFNEHQRIIDLVTSGVIAEERLEVSVSRLLQEQLQLGLFEDPYVDAAAAPAIVGNPEFRAVAEVAQRKSIVLLKNGGSLLPMRMATSGAPVRVYTLGVDPEPLRDAGYSVYVGDHAPGTELPEVSPDTDYAVIRVRVSNPIIDLSDNPREPPPQQTVFGGAAPDELDLLAFSDMTNAKSWEMTPALEEIQAVMTQIGADRTVLAINFRQPYVLDAESHTRDAGALLALFGVSDSALVDVLTGAFPPSGKLPFSLANRREAVIRQGSDSPGYSVGDTLFDYGFGLAYE